MKKTMNAMLLAVLMLFTELSLFAQKSESKEKIKEVNEIDFKKLPWEKVKKYAKAQKKMIFLDCYTTWCYWCKVMDKSTFKEESVVDYYSENFVNVRYNMEEGDGKILAEEYDINRFPTYMFFDSDGNFVHRGAGFRDQDQFLELAREAQDPESQIVLMMNRYDEGNRSADLLYDYAFALAAAGLDGDDVVEAYIATQSSKEMLTHKNWEFISTFVLSSNEPTFQLITKYREIYENLEGAEAVQDYIDEVIDNDIYAIAKLQDRGKLKELKAKIAELTPIEKRAFATMAKADYQFYKKNEATSHKYASLYFDELCKDWSELNDVSRSYFENETDQAKLQKAADWAKRSTELELNWFNTDTYANLLFKLGKLGEAKAAAQRSINVGKQNDEDVTETKNLLAKINEKLKSK